MIIANGSSDRVLTRIMEGEPLGTTFLAQEGLASRDKWIAFNLADRGQLIIDRGASKALEEQGSSLLACGILEATGDFVAGDVIDIVDQSHEQVARGLVNYSQEEIEQIKGLQSSQIKSELGYQAYDEVIHRDNLVLV
jgi:glutamate 5-kinase